MLRNVRTKSPTVLLRTALYSKSGDAMSTPVRQEIRISAIQRRGHCHSRLNRWITINRQPSFSKPWITYETEESRSFAKGFVKKTKIREMCYALINRLWIITEEYFATVVALALLRHWRRRGDGEEKRNSIEREEATKWTLSFWFWTENWREEIEEKIYWNIYRREFRQDFILVHWRGPEKEKVLWKNKDKVK